MPTAYPRERGFAYSDPGDVRDVSDAHPGKPDMQVDSEGVDTCT